MFVSEYNAPDDFVCVWEREVKVTLSPVTSKQATENYLSINQEYECIEFI